jgi:RNA 2',3'-cyclic 3'-phosphodiesterase
MRLFTGLDLPGEVETQLDRLLQDLRPHAPGLNWSPLRNLHITTKFIGAWPEERLPELVQALTQAVPRPSQALEIQVRGVGWFPNPHSPRVLFAAVNGSGGELHHLAKATDEACASIGIARETKPYSPHLTLARIRDVSIPLAPLRQAIARQGSLDFGTFRPQSYFLYRSEPGPRASVYTKLSEFPLTTAAAL